MEYENGLRKLQIVLNANKLGKVQLILQSKVEFLGYVIENEQLRSSEGKTKAIKKFPEPTNTRRVYVEVFLN